MILLDTRKQKTCGPANLYRAAHWQSKWEHNSTARHSLAMFAIKVLRSVSKSRNSAVKNLHDVKGFRIRLNLAAIKQTWLFKLKNVWGLLSVFIWNDRSSVREIIITHPSFLFKSFSVSLLASQSWQTMNLNFKKGDDTFSLKTGWELLTAQKPRKWLRI